MNVTNAMKKHSTGFTLIEVMIVVALVAILAAIAYPSYQSQLLDARRADGQEFLLQTMSLQERFYTENNTYTDDLTDLGYDNATNEPSGDEFYRVTAAQCGAEALTACVLLTAVAQPAQAADGDLTLNSRNERTGNW